MYSTQQLKEHFNQENYDEVIVGSDQTWRPKYSPNIYNYFLDFLREKTILRIAYASSFGVDEWEFNKSQTKRCAQLVKKFDAISVREDSGVDLCRKYLGVEAQFVLDPTLLLDSLDYEKLIGSDRIKDKKEGIYTYFLDITNEKKMLARQASRETGEPIFSCLTKSGLTENFIENVSEHVIPDPRDWLAGFVNAKYVLTDSFHGVVFSLIFNKPFIAVENRERGSARFKSLFKEFGINSNFLYENKRRPLFNSDQYYILEEAQRILNKNRKDSMKWLSGALQKNVK